MDTCDKNTARLQKQLDVHDKRINSLEISTHVTVADLSRLGEALDAHLQANIVAHDKMYSTMTPLLEAINKNQGATSMAKWIGGFAIVGVVSFFTYLVSSIIATSSAITVLQNTVDAHNATHKAASAYKTKVKDLESKIYSLTHKRIDNE